MAANHGVDRQGNQIGKAVKLYTVCEPTPLSVLLSLSLGVTVVLTIRMHHKDSKRTAMILRWVAFCYEANVRMEQNRVFLKIHLLVSSCWYIDT